MVQAILELLSCFFEFPSTEKTDKILNGMESAKKRKNWISFGAWFAVGAIGVLAILAMLILLFLAVIGFEN